MEIFVGIDQTGAASLKGRKAKPLPMCIAVKQRSGTWRFFTKSGKGPLMLDSFHCDSIQKQFEILKLKSQWDKTAFIVDCVLGLPKQLRSNPTKGKPYLWGYFEKAAGFSKNGKEFGREVAEDFFSKLLPADTKEFPKRFCEELSGSNSVFQVRPYQKNIQTGSFRLWKDIGSVGKPWLKLWPFETSDGDSALPWIFEGYPSLIWKDCLGSAVRSPKDLRKLSEKAFPQFEIDTWQYVEKHPDTADSFVLAFGGVFLQEKGRLWKPFPGFQKENNALREGWLLGLKPPKDI
ncbi:MAG: hypothetical protein ACKN9V_03845 [Pseudomonadota bacterium]